MNRQRELLVTTPAPRKYQVPLDDGTVWTGTKRQLLESHPSWLPFAVEVQPAPDTQHEDYSSDVLTQIEQDYADADNPRLNRLPRSSINYQTKTGQRVRAEWQPGTVVQRRRSAQTPARDTEENAPQVQPRRNRGGFFAHPFLYMGIGMIAMLALWVLLQMAVSWWTLHNDDVTYGRPRTFQFDAVFGHADSAANPTHIIIVNLSRHIIIIELPGGDPSKSKIYSGPTLFGDGQDLTPVTGRAVDVNGDGKLNLVLYVQDQRIVFINDGTQFRPLKSGEQITIPK